MPGPKNRLLHAALDYAAAGLPVTPAFPMVRADAGGRWRRQWACGCGRFACPTPGAHPMGAARRVRSAERISALWGVESPPGLLISPSGAIDLWRLPRELGALGMRLLEAQRPALWPPLMQLPDGSWMVGTMPLDGPAPAIAAYGLPVLRVGPDDIVAVPPSRHPGGRLHWLWSQRFPATPLPEPGPVLAALASAAERLKPWQSPDVAPASLETAWSWGVAAP